MDSSVSNEKNDAIGQRNEDQDKPCEKDIFSTDEIMIEELAIDGICGVY